MYARVKFRAAIKVYLFGMRLARVRVKSSDCSLIGYYRLLVTQPQPQKLSCEKGRKKKRTSLFARGSPRNFRVHGRFIWRKKKRSNFFLSIRANKVFEKSISKYFACDSFTTYIYQKVSACTFRLIVDLSSDQFI